MKLDCFLTRINVINFIVLVFFKGLFLEFSWFNIRKGVLFMKILIPLLSGRENDPLFINSIDKSVKEVVVLQIVDKQFLPKAGLAIGEVRQFRIVADGLRKALSLKKKKLIEMTEWGVTIPKIVSIALLQKVDYVLLVKQDTQFLEEVISGLKSKKIRFELIELPVVETAKKKLF